VHTYPLPNPFVAPNTEDSELEETKQEKETEPEETEQEEETPPEIPPVIKTEKTQPQLDWDNFDVHKIYLSTIYIYTVYGADGSFFMVDDWIYVIAPQLIRMKPDGSEREELPEEVSKYWLYEATYYDGWIYFISNRYMYIDTLPPPGTNEHLLRMRPDGTDLQECIKDVFYFEIHNDWIFYQSGWSLYTVKIDGWDKPIVIHKNSEKKEGIYTQATWLIRRWFVYDQYIFYSISETYGGAGQYNTKMFRVDLNGTNKILLIESTVFTYDPRFDWENTTVFDPRFIYEGYLYFSSYDFGVGNKLFRMDLDGENIITIIEPSHYVLLSTLEIRDGWLYYIYSWNQGTTPQRSTRKVRPDGTDDQLANSFVFGGNNSGGDYVMWLTWDDASEGKVTRNRLHIAPTDGSKGSVVLFDGGGWESVVSYYIWQGNIYIYVISWR